MQIKVLCKCGAMLVPHALNKSLLIMRLTILLIALASLKVTAGTYAQTVSFSGKNVHLKEVFAAVEQQTGYVFFYKPTLLKHTKPVSIETDAVTLEDFMQLALKNQQLDYAIENKTIFISPSPAPELPEVIRFTVPINGLVMGADGRWLAGASVVIKGRSGGVSTDVNGRFSIQANEGDILMVRFVGYADMEFRVGKNGNVTLLSTDRKTTDLSRDNNGWIIRMVTAETALREVTVNAGYFKTTERTKTGNITKITAAEIERQPVTSLLAALQGRVPGMDITPSNGHAGVGMIVQIRGQNSLRFTGSFPLFIIDGVPIDSRPIYSANNGVVGAQYYEYAGFDPLSMLNPANVESIEVLKDGDATAMYGSRGANGVILITTKSARPGKTSLDVRASTGFGKLIRQPRMLTTKEYVTMRKEAFANDGIDPIPAETYDLNLWDTTRETNWQKALLGRTARNSDIQLGLSGGNRQTSYNLGAGYFKQTPMYHGDFGFTRISANLSINHISQNEKLRVTVGANYGSTRNRLFSDNNFLGFISITAPNAPALYDEKGELNWEIGEIFPGYFAPTFRNPLSFLQRTSYSMNGSLTANSSISYQLLPELQLRVGGGYSDMIGNEVNKTPVESYPPNERRYVSGSASFATNYRYSWNVEPQVIFRKKKRGHDVELVTGVTLQHMQSNVQTLYGYGYVSDALLGSIMNAPTKSVGLDRTTQYRSNGVYARLNYNWNEKYLLGISVRRDGSSRFGPDKRFGNFGSVGFGWIFSEEKLLKEHLPFLSFGKLRGSYATTGNDQIGDYAYYESYTSTTDPYLSAVSLYPIGLLNPDYAWEQTRKSELALELGFFQDRVRMEIAAYYNRSSDQLVDYALPEITGFEGVLSNLPAVIQNHGLEILLNTKNISGRQLQWSTSLNVSLPGNKLVKFDGIENTIYATQYEVGKPLSVQYLATWLGVDPQTGLHTFEDINKDGEVNYLDKKLQSRVGRGWYAGIGNTFTYRDFELNFLLQVSNSTTRGFVGAIQPGALNNQLAMVMDRWQKPGDVKSTAKFTSMYDQNYSDLFERSTANTFESTFIRLKTLSLNYRLPKRMVEGAGFSNASIYLQGANLFSITNFPGWDPETGSSFPSLKSLTVGVQFKL